MMCGEGTGKDLYTTKKNKRQDNFFFAAKRERARVFIPLLQRANEVVGRCCKQMIARSERNSIC